MAAVIARGVRDGEAVGIGVNSPVPTAGVLLARRLHAPNLRLRSPGLGGAVAFIGSKEFFDFAQRGQLDLFFLSGIQIDAQARINLHVLGDYAHPERRFAGAFGSAVLYPVVGRVILFRLEHSPRVFVEEVDFVTAAGRPDFVVTPKAVLKPHPETGRLELASYHPGESVESVRAATGFELAARADAHETSPPSEAELELLRGPILEEMAGAYPSYVAAHP
jgi:glutaconate CoA-transferase subunit B